MDTIKRNLAIFVASLFLFAQVCAAERTAPVFPNNSTIESGKSYYLYNVGSDKFLTTKLEVGEYAKAVAVDVIQREDSSYTLQYSSDKYYIYANSTETGTRSSLSNICYFTIATTADGYTIQRAPKNSSYYNETQFVGSADGDTEILPNLTEGNIVWKFLEKDAAEYYIAKRRLYDALQTTDTYFYAVDNFEKVYNDPTSSTELLKEAADYIEGGLLLSSKVEAREWSDYPIFFINDADKNWGYNSGGYDYNSNLEVRVYNPGTYSLKARVKTDADATLSYYLYSQYAMAAEVLIDGVTVREIEGTMTKETPGNNYSRYFEKLSPGTHEIEWRYTRTTAYNGYYQYGIICGIGIEKTPYFEVNLVEPGSLGTEVLYNVDHVKDVRRIKIKGRMNDDDWSKVSMMTSLYSIDLSETDVTLIPEDQFYNEPFLHEVILPDSLEEIGDDAFYGSYIQKMNFPSTLRTIGRYAFYNAMITEAILPDSTILDVYAFAYCHHLTKVHYPKYAKSVPTYCFSGCSHLESFVLPEGLTVINSGAFSGATKFNPRFPKSLETLGTGAFEETAIDSLILPEGVSLGYTIFEKCKKLVYAEFPTSYYEETYLLNSSPIRNCYKLNTLVLKSPTVVGGDDKDDFLNGCPNDVVIKVPSFLVNSYKLDEYWYNYKIEGFNTGDVKNWTLNNDLVMNVRERFDGEPNLTINRNGSIKLNGDVQQLFDTIRTYSYNYYSGTSKDAYARILVNNDATKILGQYKHAYYTTGKYWYFVSLPFDFKVSEVTPGVKGTKFVFRYYDGASRAANGASGNWKNYADDAVIAAGTGFIVQTSADCWLYFTALENESKQNVVSNEAFVKALDENVSSTASNRGWNLVGNPWQCWYNIHALNFTAPITTYDVYNKKYNAYSVIDDDYAIAPNEAFFVQCPENINSISFPETGRQLTSVIESQQSAPLFNAAGAVSSRQLVDVVLSCGELNDRTRVVFNDVASMEYETACDASKFFATEGIAPQLYTIDEEGTEYAINERPYNGGYVQLGIVIAQKGTYTFSLSRCNAREVVLFDNATGVTHNFADGEYSFTAEAGICTDRFVLGVTKSPETTSIENLAELGIKVEAGNGCIEVSGAEGVVSVTAIDGRTVAELESDGTVLVSAGTYIVCTNAGAVKVVVK